MEEKERVISIEEAEAHLFRAAAQFKLYLDELTPANDHGEKALRDFRRMTRQIELSFKKLHSDKKIHTLY